MHVVLKEEQLLTSHAERLEVSFIPDLLRCVTFRHFFDFEKNTFFLANKHIFSRKNTVFSRTNTLAISGQRVHVVLQEDQLLTSRAKCLEDLRQVFSERSRLNLMAIGIMLPHPGNIRHECFDPSPEAKLKCMEVNGSLYCMRSEKELTDVLDSLKLNLKAEQKLIMELNYVFVHKVLLLVCCGARACRVESDIAGLVLMGRSWWWPQPEGGAKADQLNSCSAQGAAAG